MPIVLSSSATDVAPLASRLLSARGIGELALQKVGAYTPNDEGADPNELDRALEWMEIEIAELAEVHRPQWLVPATLTVGLEADEKSFDLADRAGADYPSLGVAYPISAWINSLTGSLAYDAQTANFAVGGTITGATSGATARITEIDDDGSTGTLTVSRIDGAFIDDEIITGSSGGSATVNGDYPYSNTWTQVDMVRRTDYEANDDGVSGEPTIVYIDRLNDRPQVYVNPVPSDDTTSLRIVVQTYARSVIGDLSEDESGDVNHGFARGWQKWLVNQTAQAIGNGPVRRLDANTLRDIRAEAAASLTLLLRTQNRENVSLRMRRTRRYGD